MQKQYKKTLTKKTLWTFEWPKMGHIFKNTYHNYSSVDLNFFLLTCILKSYLNWLLLIWTFLVH
jgi:hypothetical protein